MNDKIWKFDILIDDSFVNFNPNSVEITPDTNDFLISLVNGFEEGQYMYLEVIDYQLFAVNTVEKWIGCYLWVYGK